MMQRHPRYSMTLNNWSGIDSGSVVTGYCILVYVMGDVGSIDIWPV